MKLPQEWQPRRWLTFEQQEHDRKVGLLHPPVERFVVLHRLPRADALLAHQQDEGCCLGDFLGKLRQPEAAGTQALGREKATRIGVLAPQRRFKRLHQRKVLRIVTQKPATHSSTALEPLRVPMTRATRHGRVAGYRIGKDQSAGMPDNLQSGRRPAKTIGVSSGSRAAVKWLAGHGRSALSYEANLDVRFGSKADICSAKRHVRFTPNNGHSRLRLKCPLSAMCGRLRVGKSFFHVCSLGRCSHVFGL